MKTLQADTKITRHIAAAPVSARGIFTRAFSGSASPRQAIKAKCLDCANFDRAEVGGCLVVLCPLHAYRPYQKDAETMAEQTAVKSASNAVAEAVEEELSTDVLADPFAVSEA